MKNFRFALVALLAIGITMATQGGVFSHSRLRPNIVQCYSVVTIPPPGASLNKASSGCATGMAQMGATATAFSGVISNPGLTCPGGGRFCCANISDAGLVGSSVCWTGH